MLQQSEAVGRLLEPSDLATLTGAVTAVLVTTNVLRHAFGWRPKIVGLVSSGVCAIIQAAAQANATWVTWVLIIPNALLIYAGATGVSGISGSRPRNAAKTRGRDSGALAEEVEVPLARFWDPWW